MNKLYREHIEENMYNIVETGKQKYARYLEAARKANPNLSTIQESNIIKNIRSLENDPKLGIPSVFKNITNATKYITEASTRPSNIDSFINYAFDVITAMNVNNPMEEFVSIQAIEKRVGEIFFMDIVKASTKGTAHTADDNYLDSQYGPNTSWDYSNDRVGSEVIYTGDGSTLVFSGTTLARLPIKPYNSTVPYNRMTGVTITYTIGGTVYTKIDDGAGAFAADTELASGTINYTTGAIALTFQTGKAPDDTTSILATYWQDSAREDVNANNELIFKASSAIVVAERRFLNTKWMLDSSIMLQKEHGKEIDNELVEKVLSGVMNENAVEMAKRLYDNATTLDPDNPGNPYDFDRTPPSATIPYVTHRQEIVGLISSMGTDIENATQKVTANFVIGGSNLIKIIKGLPNDYFDAVKYVDKTPTGMHVVGVLDNQWKVIQNFNYGVNEFLVGAKGPDWMTTGAMWCPFIPLMVTPTNWEQSGDHWRSLLQWAASHIINAKFFAPGIISKS